MGILFPNMTEHKCVIKSGEKKSAAYPWTGFYSFNLIAVVGIQYLNIAWSVLLSNCLTLLEARDGQQEVLYEQIAPPQRSMIYFYDKNLFHQNLNYFNHKYFSLRHLFRI